MYTTITPNIETTRQVVLTDKGECVLAVYRLLAGLRALSADDRGSVLELLELELADQRA